MDAYTDCLAAEFALRMLLAQQLTAQPTEHEKAEWSSMAHAAYACDQNTETRMNKFRAGDRCIFDPITDVSKYPKYHAHSGQAVRIIGALEDRGECDTSGPRVLYRVCDRDGWVGYAYEEELRDAPEAPMPIVTHGLVLAEWEDGWSLHAPGSTDEEIADGDAPSLLDGPGKPTQDDYDAAYDIHERHRESDD